MKRLLSIAVLCAVCFSSFAQHVIKGTVIDSDTQESIPQATIKLLRTDSTFVSGAGVVSDMSGNFSLKTPAAGKYILQISYVGYNNFYRNVNISNSDLALGRIVMKANSIMLKGAEIVKNVAKVTVKEDTFMYNAAAYRAPEGSVMEELVRKIPGAEVSDDGTLKINGKEVKKIKVDGKEFFTGDTRTAMKNLPTSVIERLKVYDEKSDLSKVTGIDDGNESTILDVQMKRGMNKGFFGNVSLGAGTKSRYADRVMGAYFKDVFRVMGFGNANNVNDRGFPGGGGRFGSGRQGLSASKSVGINFNYGDRNKSKLAVDGSVRWSHNDGDAFSKTSAEYFVSSASSFSNSINQNFSRNNSWNFNMRLEWNPDTLTNIMFRPSFGFSTNDGLSNSNSASFNRDPYLYMLDPLNDIHNFMDTDSIRINSRENASLSYGKNSNFNGSLQFNRRLSDMGRNVTVSLSGGYNDSKNNRLSTSRTTLYQLENYLATGDSTYFTNRYNITPSKSYNYSAQFTYSEPIMKATFLQFSYQFQYRHNESDRATYDFSRPLSLGEQFFNGGTMQYRGWNPFLNTVNDWTANLDDSLSRFSEYNNYIHEISLQLRVIREKYNFNAGVRFEPQTNKFRQDYWGLDTTITRSVMNWSPTLNFNYRFNRTNNLRVNYRGNSSQPGIGDLLSIRDDSDPLNITTGNPSLKPSFTNNLSVFYNGYFERYQRAIMVNTRFSTTSNSIANMVTYNELTGGRLTRPENVNGNWNASGEFMFNTALDTLGRFNINTFTSLAYNHRIGYVTLNRQSSSQRNATNTTTVGERVAGSYRNDWLEIELNGAVNYDHTRNKLQVNNNLDTWRFSYGGSVNVTLPWGMNINTNMNMNSRRGYNDASMNTNELIWNAQINQGFLTGKTLNVSLQFYDILREQSNFSRVINAVQRSDTQYNSINSFVMLTATYRLNIFGGKNAHQGDPNQGFGRDRRNNRGNRGFGGQRFGGFGGGGRF